VKNRNWEGINIPRTLFVFEDPQQWLDFDFSKLTGIGFVVKANHGSGMNKLFQKRQNLLQSDKQEIVAWFKYPSHLNSREDHYKHITKKVFIEELLEEDIRDYKIHSFSSNKQYLQVDYDRFNGHTRNIFDINGKLLDLEINYPRNLSEMSSEQDFRQLFRLANQIREDLAFNYLRVDFYIHEGQTYLGELTFHPGGGVEPFDSYKSDLFFGSLLELN